MRVSWKTRAKTPNTSEANHCCTTRHMVMQKIDDGDVNKGASDDEFFFFCFTEFLIRSNGFFSKEIVFKGVQTEQPMAGLETMYGNV